jgi:predicted DNA-binding protein (UPF0251 family)
MVGFKPFGIAFCEKEHIVLTFDEYESIRLVNYKNFSQEEAAEKMEVSRPTLTRIFISAQRKIAQAFVEGKSIVIDGGNFEFENEWYKCKKCNKLIEGIENHIKCINCKNFTEEELIKINK